MTAMAKPQVSHEFIINRTHWPIIEVTYPAIATLQSIDEYLDQISRLYHEANMAHRHTASISDMSAVMLNKVTQEHTQAMVKGFQAIDSKYFGVAVCDAIVSQSPMLRAFVTAQAIVRTKRNHVTRAFSDKKDAMNWINLTLNASKRH